MSMLKIEGLLSLRFRHSATAIFFCTSKSEIKRFGHALAHAPHPVHNFSSTMGMPSDPIFIAENLHAATQSPKPEHPNAHIFIPPIAWTTAAHVWTPLYSPRDCAKSFVPRQHKTAAFFTTHVYFPKIFAREAATAGPPGAHKFGS